MMLPVVTDDDGRARSRDEFIAKLGLVVEEADEANELTAIFVASRRTAVSRHKHRRYT